MRDSELLTLAHHQPEREGLTEEQDEPLPPDQWIKCGRCRTLFFSVVHRKRPTFVCLFCAPCEAAIAEGNRVKDERDRERRAAKKAARKVSKKTMKSVVDAVISGVK